MDLTGSIHRMWSQEARGDDITGKPESCSIEECGFAVEGQQPSGAWVVWNYGDGYNVESIHAEEIDALRAAVALGYPARVLFARWGDDVGSLLRAAH